MSLMETLELPVSLMETHDDSSDVNGDSCSSIVYGDVDDSSVVDGDGGYSSNVDHDGDPCSSIIYGDSGASDAFVGSVKKTKASGYGMIQNGSER